MYDKDYNFLNNLTMFLNNNLDNELLATLDRTKQPKEKRFQTMQGGILVDIPFLNMPTPTKAIGARYLSLDLFNQIISDIELLGCSVIELKAINKHLIVNDNGFILE